jgi:hypothetical protein
MRAIDADALDYELGTSDRDIYVRECLAEAPSVTPETHWIPVTERLPETDKWRTTYLVTTDNGIVTAMEWENTTVRGKSTSRWVWHDRLSPWKVIAWKPLPELYKEVTT